VFAFLWRAVFSWSKGYRLRPWRSPYLCWRIETFWGLHADRMGVGDFIRFTWQRRRDLLRFAKWASEMPPKVMPVVASDLWTS
jgi:hypothetical protein